MTTEIMQTAEFNDAELVAGSLGGNREAFRRIVERYQTLVSSLAYCATGNVSQSEDLAQQTFVNAWQQLADLREPDKLRPWLCSITRFLISKEFRRLGREPAHAAESLEVINEWVSPEPLPPDHAISDEEKAILWRSLERIPEIYREPLVLFYREHQSIEAVARDLDLSEDAVKQRLSRGRKRLQEQFLAFVAGALKETAPDKTFTLGVIAALPLLAASAKATTAGTALAKHGGVAAKATGSGGLVQGIFHAFMGVVGWVAAALPLGGYLGYKMGGDSRNSERASRSVAAFWRTLGIGMFCFVGLPLPVMFLLYRMFHLSDAKGYAMLGCWWNICLPIFLFGVVPLSIVLWIWQRRRRTAPEGAVGRPFSRRFPGLGRFWVILAMTAAIGYLTAMGWLFGRAPRPHFPQIRYLSTSEVQNYIANSEVPKFRFIIFQSASGVRILSGDLLENRKMSPFVAPAEDSTVALLDQKGINYETKIENRNYPPVSLTRAGWWSRRLLNPFCCFILVAGAVTLLRGSRNRQSQPHFTTNPGNERRVDKIFAALAAGGMVALAVFQGITTDWKVRTISTGQVPAIVAQHKDAQFKVFEYLDGSRKLWISDHRTPDFIAPANEFTLGVLTRQGITYQTYVAGTAGLTPPNQSISGLWILALTAGAGGLFWWVVKRRPASASCIHNPETI